mmetsp:Transcript_62471/g.136726  ORF Transcript_62471/g.136726 Transcript_62471/m.136726 type:complete len:237 (+) Transcript_62471:517-1227(+)
MRSQQWVHHTIHRRMCFQMCSHHLRCLRRRLHAGTQALQRVKEQFAVVSSHKHTKGFDPREDRRHQAVHAQHCTSDTTPRRDVFGQTLNHQVRSVFQGIEQRTRQPGVVTYEDALGSQFSQLAQDLKIPKLPTGIGAGFEVKDPNGFTSFPKELQQLLHVGDIHRYTAHLRSAAVCHVMHRAWHFTVEFAAIDQRPRLLASRVGHGGQGRPNGCHPRGQQQRLMATQGQTVELQQG